MILGNLMSVITILRSVGAPAEDIYGAGLIYSAVLSIASAFKRTDIVYIQ